jgi:class 3 adenylate cyclase/tetratricopeptide (TPR) repeat protein
VSVCPNCGEENPEGFRFCGHCSAPLREASRPTGEERKVVTVLFCDLVGFTARADGADPEDVRAGLRPYHARVRKEIERFGGTVEKFIGDAVMAVFGAPVAHEDDAERGVRSAMRICDAIVELNQQNTELDLAVRIGVNTGEAVVTLGARPAEGEAFVAGDVVNTAARLQQAAPTNGVVVGEVTYRATKDVIEYEESEPVRVKGKAEPVTLWRARAPRTRFGVDVEQAARAPFVGRQDELELMKRTFARTVNESGVQLVTVTGEPGVGKTRLVWEFRSYLDDQPGLVYWRQGRCLPYGEGVTFWALGEMVKAQAGILESDDPEHAARKIEVAVRAVVADASEQEWLEARLAPLVGISGSDGGRVAEREESFAAWRRFLEAIAALRPLVLVFEDLHWADPALLDFVEHLVDWSTEVPLLVLCTARPELYERYPAWGGGKRNSTTLALAPLAEQDTAHLISALLSQAVLPAEVHAALLERCGGNPLYAEEFVRMLLDRGVLERHGRTVRIAPGSEIPVPETVQALIAARLDTLPPERKSLLQDGSVVGKVFWSGAVSFMGGIDERTARVELHELGRKELLRPARTSSVKDQAEYSFWHVLVRDVAYGQIPRAARGRKHRLAAEWIERVAGDRVADLAEFLAFHYERALELARSAAETEEVPTLEEGTSRFLVMAGDRAFHLDLRKAYEFYRRALELLPVDHPDRPRVLAEGMDAGGGAGLVTLDEAEPRFLEAIEAFRNRGDLLGAGGAALSLAGWVWVRGETSRAARIAREAADLQEPLGSTPQLAEAFDELARYATLGGRRDEGLQWTEQALALARELGIGRVEARALQFRGIIRCERGDVAGLEDLRESLRMCLELGVTFETGTAYTNLGSELWMIHGPASALEIYREGIEFATRRGFAGQVAWIRAEMLWAQFDLGDWDEVLRVADELLEWDPAGARTQQGVFALSYKARVLVSRGELAGALALCANLLPRARAIRDPQVLAPALEVAAMVELARGGEAGVSAAAALIEELDRESGVLLLTHGLTAANAARALVAAGKPDGARAFLEKAAGGVGRAEHNLVAGRAVLAESLGELKEALDLYSDAAAGWSRFGVPLEQALALLGAGRALVHLDRPAEATTYLREARDIFTRLRARALLEEADHFLERAVALTS